MRKMLLSLGIFIFSFGCTPSNKIAEIDDLKKTIEDLKPGLGDIMGGIQQHHIKLYFAGKGSNWDLAKFELHEIQEGFEAATRWHDKVEGVETPVAQLIKIKDRSMQELESAIEKKSRDQFLTSFSHLTKACNECHTSANHSFIVIQEPKGSVFTNQKLER